MWVETYLFDPARLADVEKRYAASTPITVDYSPQLSKVAKQERNLANAIKEGGHMPTLVAALREVQAERERLEKVAGGAQVISVRRANTEPVARRIERMRARLAEGGDVARDVLAELFRTSIWLEDNGEQFYALFEDGLGSALFGELARPEEFQGVENNGSGGLLRAL